MKNIKNKYRKFHRKSKSQFNRHLLKPLKLNPRLPEIQETGLLVDSSRRVYKLLKNKITTKANKF